MHQQKWGPPRAENSWAKSLHRAGVTGRTFRAEGMRRRAGLRVWPTLRYAEAELVAQLRQTLGAERFDQAFSAGSGLSRREAVTDARSQPGTRTS